MKASVCLLGVVTLVAVPGCGLSLPCPSTGKVVDADTGQPVWGARVAVTWTIYDYPMLDGYGSYKAQTEAFTDRQGQFTLIAPRQRRGFFMTEPWGPTVTAWGYLPVGMSDSDSQWVTHASDSITFRLRPDQTQRSLDWRPAHPASQWTQQLPEPATLLWLARFLGGL